jgi:hypothetical protein
MVVGRCGPLPFWRVMSRRTAGTLDPRGSLSNTALSLSLSRARARARSLSLSPGGRGRGSHFFLYPHARARNPDPQQAKYQVYAVREEGNLGAVAPNSRCLVQGEADPHSEQGGARATQVWRRRVRDTRGGVNRRSDSATPVDVEIDPHHRRLGRSQTALLFRPLFNAARRRRNESQYCCAGNAWTIL